MATHAKWIWYPGEREIYLANHMLIKRDYRLRTEYPFWRIDNPYPLVYFYTDVDLAETERIRIVSNGEIEVYVDAVTPVYAESDGSFVLPVGKHNVTIIAAKLNAEYIYLLVDGKNVKSDETWQATLDNYRGEKFPVGFSDTDAEKFKPFEVDFERTELKARELFFAGKKIYDFGKEIFGYVKIVCNGFSGDAVVYYGESPAEAVSEDACETIDVCSIPEGTKVFSVKNSRGFRYVCLSGSDLNKIGSDKIGLYAVGETLPLRMRGSFVTDNGVVNEIEKTAEYTFTLNARETFIDGIKRDRWCWAGDAYQSCLFNYYSCFDADINRRTLWALLGKEPYTHYPNHIQDYAYFWFIALYDHYFYTGDIFFLRSIFPHAVKLLDFCVAQIGKDGFVRGDAYRDWVFLDWTDIPKEGVVSAEQILFCVALERMSRLAKALGDQGLSSKLRKRYLTLKRKIFSLFYDEEKGLFYNNAVEGKITGSVTVYSNIFAVMYSLVNEQQKEKIIKSVILNREIEKIRTPYARLYELIALCEAGKFKEAGAIIEEYWGGMLECGATTFWEFFDKSESGDEKYAMYGRPFGKSCCHAWGAGPIYINGRYFLGVKPTGIAYGTYSVTPELSRYKYIRGVVPAPDGNIEIFMDRRILKLKSTVQGEGTLYIKEKYKPKLKSMPKNGYYSVVIPGNAAIEIELGVSGEKA